MALCEDNNFLNDKFYVYLCITFDYYLVGDLVITFDYYLVGDLVITFDCYLVGDLGIWILDFNYLIYLFAIIFWSEFLG